MKKFTTSYSGLKTPIVKEFSEVAIKLIEKIKLKNFASIVSYGSTNYGTRTEDSDFDLKIFVVPTIDDLLKGKNKIKDAKDVELDIDYQIVDIRKIPMMAMKGNSAFLELFFSKVIIFEGEGELHETFPGTWLEIIDLINELNKINTERILKAMRGIMHQKFSAIQKDLPKNIDNVKGIARKEKYGYDTKQLLHIERIYFMANKIATNIEYKDALVPTKEEAEKLLSIKKGMIKTKEEALEYAQKLIKKVESWGNCLNGKEKENKEKILALHDKIEYWIFEYIKETFSK